MKKRTKAEAAAYQKARRARLRKEAEIALSGVTPKPPVTPHPKVKVTPTCLQLPELLSIKSPAVPLNVKFPCVYFLFHGESLVYVGQSHSLTYRVGTHQREKDFDSIAVIEVSEADVNRIEHAYINRYAPMYNKNGLPLLNVSQSPAAAVPCPECALLRAEVARLKAQLERLDKPAVKVFADETEALRQRVIANKVSRINSFATGHVIGSARI